MNTLPEALPARGSRSWRLAPVLEPFRYPLAVYSASRLVYFLLVLADSAAHHTNITTAYTNWDGSWYIQTTEHWYPNYFNNTFTHFENYSTFGFLPLFPMVMWLFHNVTQLSVAASGLTLSIIFGAIATVLVTKLAEEWWGTTAARRAVLFWCFFPGTVVFSMVYTEGLTISLVAGCMLLLARKRWAWAGLLAGLSTAVGPVALAIIPACVVAAVLEIRAGGWDWRDRQARRSLWAPILSPVGIVGFAVFLWIHAGTPLASFRAQHGAWAEKTTPLAIPQVFGSLIHQIFISGVGSRHGPDGIDLNGVLALLGTVFLFYGVWRLWKVRDTLPIPVWTWIVVAGLLALTSAKTPPNPRLLICVFPVVLIVGAEHTGRTRRWLLIADLACMLLFSWFTYIGLWLRP